MVTICFIRHGETDWNVEGRIQGRTDVPLNYKGIHEALNSTELLKDKAWDFIITSPLKRAKQTAEIIGQNLKIKEIYEDSCFIEKDFGNAEGVLGKDIKRKFPNGVIYGMEEEKEFHVRINTGLTKIINKYDNMNIILVTHSGVIKYVLSFLIDDVSNLKLYNGGMYIITYCKDKDDKTSYRLVSRL